MTVACAVYYHYSFERQRDSMSIEPGHPRTSQRLYIDERAR